MWLIFCGNSVVLRRRAGKGLLAGLWEFPNELTDSAEGLEQWHIESESQTFAGAGKHIFTHIEWHMRAIQVETKQVSLPEDWVWASREELERDYAVPNAFQSFQPIVEKRMGRTTQ